MGQDLVEVSAGEFRVVITVPIIVLFVAGRKHILDNLMIGSVKS